MMLQPTHGPGSPGDPIKSTSLVQTMTLSNLLIPPTPVQGSLQQIQACVLAQDPIVANMPSPLPHDEVPLFNKLISLNPEKLGEHVFRLCKKTENEAGQTLFFEILQEPLDCEEVKTLLEKFLSKETGELPYAFVLFLANVKNKCYIPSKENLLLLAQLLNHPFLLKNEKLFDHFELFCLKQLKRYYQTSNTKQLIASKTADFIEALKSEKAFSASFADFLKKKQHTVNPFTTFFVYVSEQRLLADDWKLDPDCKLFVMHMIIDLKTRLKLLSSENRNLLKDLIFLINCEGPEEKEIQQMAIQCVENFYNKTTKDVFTQHVVSTAENCLERELLTYPRLFSGLQFFGRCLASYKPVDMDPYDEFKFHLAVECDEQKVIEMIFCHFVTEEKQEGGKTALPERITLLLDDIFSKPCLQFKDIVSCLSMLNQYVFLPRTSTVCLTHLIRTLAQSELTTHPEFHTLLKWMHGPLRNHAPHLRKGTFQDLLHRELIIDIDTKEMIHHFEMNTLEEYIENLYDEKEFCKELRISYEARMSTNVATLIKKVDELAEAYETDKRRDTACLERAESSETWSLRTSKERLGWKLLKQKLCAIKDNYDSK